MLGQPYINFPPVSGASSNLYGLFCAGMATAQSPLGSFVVKIH